MAMKKSRRAVPAVAEAAPPYGEPGVKIAEFKAHLSHHLQAVRAGQTLVILDRKTPIARVAPYQALPDRLVVRKATRPWGSHTRRPVGRKGAFQAAMDILLEDRARR